MDKEILFKTLKIFEERSELWTSRSESDDRTAENRAICAARANAYDSAWWLLTYALHEDWENLNQFIDGNDEDDHTFDDDYKFNEEQED